MNSSLLIVTDRGSFKAYTLEPTAWRGTTPRLVQTFQIADARGRYQDKVTDQAGAFPNSGTGGQGNSIAEKMSLEAENETRVFRVIADQITSLLNQYRPEHWSFAAPSEINGAILDNLTAGLRAHLERNVPQDLIKTSPAELLSHFERES